MEHVCSSRNDECNFINTNNNGLDSSLEDELPLFLDFPSPFFDDIFTIPIPENNHTHQHQFSSPNKPSNTAESSASELKRTKKRSAGKKDRHSKINTAQGLRDRRMRLSLHIAQKFFDLQDLLGFDKASKTIEWLFCKSNKAIKEVADSLIINPQQTNQISVCEEIERMDSFLITSEIKAATSKLESTKEVEIKNNRESSRKQIQNNVSVKEMRDLARARARDRARERVIIKELQKSKHLFGGNPNDEEIYRFGLRCLASPNNHNVEKLGYTSSSSKPIQQEPSILSFERSSNHHQLLQDQLQSDETINNVNGFDNYSGTIVGASTCCSTLINHNRPAAGWLNYYSNRFSGMPAGDHMDAAAGSFISTDDYGIVPSPGGHLTGDIYEQNPISSFLFSSTTNIMHFQSQ